MSINSLTFCYNCNILMTTDTSFVIYVTNPMLKKKLTYDAGEISHMKDIKIGFAKLYKNSNLVGVVGKMDDDPYKLSNILIICDIDKNKHISIMAQSPIKNMLLSKHFVVIVCEKNVNTYLLTSDNVNNNPPNDSKTTFPNEKGLCSMNDNETIIATLGTKLGELAIWDIEHDDYKTINAHNTNIELIVMSACGNYVATCSEKYTLIRIFDVKTCKKMYEFRRGSVTVEIYDIVFSKDLKYLACISENGTVHFFHLYESSDNNQNVKSKLSFLKTFNNYFSSEWSFKQIALNDCSRCKIMFDNDNSLKVVSYSKMYYNILCDNGKFENVSKDDFSQ